MLSLVGFVAVGVGLFLLAQYTYSSWRQPQLLDHIPTHTFADGNNSRQRTVVHGRPFKVSIPVGGYSVKYRIILPKDYLEEIKHLSNNDFSWQLASRIIFAGDYTGAPERGPWSGKALRVGIHQNLGDINKVLEKRIDDYFATHLPQKAGELPSEHLMSFFVPAIAYVINAILVGPKLASDPEWVRRTSEFAVDRYIAADDVRRWPPYLASVAAPFIPSVRRLRDSRAYVLEKLRPMYEELRARPDSEKRQMRKGSYGFEWLFGGAPEDVSLQDFADTMMRTIIASIHTSGKTISVAFIDLLTHPKLLKELQDEVQYAAVDESIDLDKLVNLDRFLKESQRLSPVFLITMNRVFTRDYIFKCSGVKFPKGSMTSAAAAAVATDPGVFTDPNTFDGYRYRRLREENKESESSLVMGMPTMDSLGFGLGNQACPGRFMAVNNLKFMMSKLLRGWDLTLEKNGQQYLGPRPEMQYNDFSVVAPAEFSMRLRKL
ncbi:cytochrome P450 [Rhizodiscina lignyota]|uniref:Cytochrome P450 n=1 Tax=Rhizodiscina lignyota TaxID=1504668 RepID=A0A9P4M2P4_9PEZI|nr:cytochrome P450 [Rhizodiscina lignyota]